MEEEDSSSSFSQSYAPHRFVDSWTDFTADAALLDGEAEPEGCGLDQQTTDDHTYNQAPLSYELQQGLRILKELMSDSNKSVNWHFLDPVDDNHPETADYYKRIKKPIWLGKMKENFDNREYDTITQFVGDFRQMLENCYRFNGPDHFVSRRAQKLETMMEQKLNLLSRELKEKTSIAATSGQIVDESFPVIPGMRRRSRAIVPHDSTTLLNQLRVEEIQKGKEVRKQQMIERKAVLESHLQGMMEWEDKLMEDHKEEVKAMWELPSIGLLLFLCHYPFNIGEVAQFELERCLFMPRESSTLQRVMTTLLSTPFQRHKLEKTGMMPYRVWNEKLRDKMAPWFKLLKDSQDPYKVADKFGIDPFLFEVVGKKNPMRKKKFHDLSLYKKVWVLKSLCDNCVESQESLVKTIESQYPEEQKEYRLGEDADGNTYLHFPQFCGADVRIYRRAYIPEPEYDIPELEEEEPAKTAIKRKPEKKDRSRDRSKSKEKTPVPKKKSKNVKTYTSEVPVPPANRPSRLRQTIKTVLPVTTNEDSSTEDDEFESAEEEGTQSESESRSEFEEPDGCNDSGIENNTPFKNILRNRIMDRDNFSETSSIDSEMWGIHRTRSGRIRYNGAMRMNNVFTVSNENSCDFDSTLSECSLSEKDKNVLGIDKNTSHSSFDSVKIEKNFVGSSDTESNSNLCHKTMDERGDNSSKTTSNNDMISKSKHFSDRGLENLGNSEIDTGGIQNRETDSPFSDFPNSNRSLTPNKHFDDTNEDSSTSNDFSEIDIQMSTLDNNTADNCSNHKSDIETITRIFDEKMSDKICGNDSDTNSSFKNVAMATDGVSDEQSMTSNNSSQNHTKAAVISKSDVMSQKDKGEGENLDNSIKNQKFNKIGGSLENKNDVSSDETDTEFSDKMEINDIDKTTDDLHDLDNDLDKTSDYDLGTDSVENCNNDPLDENKEKDCAEEKGDKRSEKDESEDMKKGMVDVICDGTKNDLPDPLKIDIKKEPVDNIEDIRKVAMDTGNMKVKEEHEEISESMDGIQEEVVTSEVKNETKGDISSGNLEEVKEEVSSEVKEEIVESDGEDDDTDLVTGPEIGPFELVADSVEDLRNLVEKFAEAEPYTVGRGKKTKVVKPPARKRCEVQLHNRLVYLLKELEPWEQKLIQATKKARLKMKKEHQEYDEKFDNGWESDHSESTNSAAEDNAMETEIKPRMPSVPKDGSLLLQNEDSRASDDCGEWDISLRGRIRKRRIIPNNVEDQGLSKKRKPEVTTTTTQLPNILSHGKSTSANMVSLVTNSTSQIRGQTPGHLLLHTSGGQTYYTGLNQQSLSNLRMLSQTKQTAHPIIQQLLRQPGMTSPRPLVSASSPTTSQTMPSGTKLATTKPAATVQKSTVTPSKGTQPAGKVQYFAANINSLPPAVIQQLIKSNALTIQAGTSQQGMILLTAVNPADSSSSPGAKATLNLQDAVSVKTTNTVEQITSSVITTAASEINKLVNSIPSNQVKNVLNENILDRSQPITNKIPQTSIDTNVPDMQSKQSDSQRNVSASVSSNMTGINISMTQQDTLKKPVQAVPNSMQNEGAQSVPLSLPQTTQQTVFLQQNQTIVNPAVNQGIRLQNMGMNLINSGGYILNTGQNQGVALQLNPTLNIGQNMMNIGGQGLTLQQIQALALQGINLQGISLQGSNLIVQPNAGLRIQTPTNVQGQNLVTPVSSTAMQSVGTLSNLTSVVIPQQGVIMSPNVTSIQTDSALKGLLNTASCSISGLCPPISPVINSVQSVIHTSSENDIGSSIPGMDISSSPMLGVPVSPGRSQCKYASNVTVKTLLEAKKPSFPENSAENQGTIIVQSTATGVKKLKLPSKAALDSAIQTVVTEVKTSLPTVNIKVPSPVTMPSIQPRRNITKTIQSMKVPIPTTPKLESKTSGPISVQVSPPNSLQPTSPVVGQPSILQPNLSSLQSGILQPNSLSSGVLQPNSLSSGVLQPNALSSGVLNLNQLNNGGQVMLANLKSNSNIPTGQNVVQGYLTPQGLIIPSANFKNIQNLQKIGNSNVTGNVSLGVEQNVLTPSLQTSVPTLTNSLTNSAISNNIQDKLTIQNARDLKHLQNVQDLRSIAAINANLVQQMGTQQFVQKSVGTTQVKTPTAPGNFIYLSPSANLQPGSQIIMNSNQQLTPVPLTMATAVTTALSSSKPLSHISLSTAVNNTQNAALSLDTVPANKPVISLPLATAKSESAKYVSLSSAKLEQVPGVKIQSPIVSTFNTSNATLLSHLNSPVLKAGVNPFPIATTCLPSQVNGQNRLVMNANTKVMNIQHTSASPFSTPIRLQKPVVATHMTKQAPVLINQQGSSSEIMKQLAAAQALGTPVQQITNTPASNLTMAGGNKLFVHMPGQTNLVNTSVDGKMVLQLPGQQLQLNANVGNQGKIVIPVSSIGQRMATVPSAAQTSINSGLLGQQKSIPANSLANKVMIQVPGQSQTGSTMLLISPQKQFVLGSQKSVSQGLVQQSQQVPQVNIQNSIKSEKDPTQLQSTVQKVVKMTDIPSMRGQINYENNVKSSASAVNSLAISTQPIMSVMQQNTQKVVKTAPLVLPGNKSSVVAMNSVSTGLSASAKSTASLQSTSTQSPAKASGTPQKLFLYNINGQLVTAQGVPVTVDNGILKILPQPKIQMSNFNLPKSPPATTKPGQLGNVPISPKPGQSITSTQQAYLNILSNNNVTSAQSVQMLKSQSLSSSVTMQQQLVKSQPSVSIGTALNQMAKIQQSNIGNGTVQQVRSQTPHLSTGIEASQPKTVVRNLSLNLNSIQTSSISANYIAKQSVSASSTGVASIPSLSSVSIPSVALVSTKSLGSVTTPSISSANKMTVSDLVKAKPSYGFVVMPETGGQTQIVFPQPNIHSTQPPKVLVNSLQGNSLSSSTSSLSHMLSSSIPTGNTSVHSSKTLVQSLPGTLKINNSAQIVSNNVMSTNSNHHGNMNGQKELTLNTKVTNNVGNSNSSSVVDTEEAALNLLSLANQRFSSSS